MREFKATFTPKEGFASDQYREIDRPKMSETDSPRIPHNADLPVTPFTESSDVFSAIYKRYGLVDASKSEKSESDQPNVSGGKDFPRYLEEREDGKCFDKENGKSYDSVEEWQQGQETLTKRYEGVASYFERKANKEWARYKNSEANGESDIEKWEHYRRSQEYYAKAKECTEKVETISNRLDNKVTFPGSESNEKTAASVADAKETKTRELTDEERQHLKDTLGWTDRQIAKCTIGDNGTIYYRTDREDLEGKTAENGVRYERKSVVIKGIKVEGVFPVFHSAFDVQLPEDLEKASNAKQFKECNKQLKEAVQSAPDLRKQFTSEQLEDIDDGKTPEGYVWHHNEETGKMQLVKIEDHDRTQGGAAHTGGKALWGGGYNHDASSENTDSQDSFQESNKQEV